MKQCLQCNNIFQSKDWFCKCCNSEPLINNGRLIFDPLLARENDGFEESFFKDLYDLEEDSFWFKARNKIIIWAIKKYFDNFVNFLEIGCGTGFVLSAIEKTFRDRDLFGSEIFIKGLSYASTRVKNATLFQMNANKIPYKDEFDLIGAFDVLEHIKDDELALNEIYKALKPSGGIILTVPQHMSLWSKVDEYSHHFRRYEAFELKNKIEKAGFKTLRMTSFISLLFPLFYISRLRYKFCKDDIKPSTELNNGFFINKVLESVLDFERIFIKQGFNFPIGSSLLLVAKK